jgi:hypothetical protein
MHRQIHKNKKIDVAKFEFGDFESLSA